MLMIECLYKFDAYTEGIATQWGKNDIQLLDHEKWTQRCLLTKVVFALKIALYIIRDLCWCEEHFEYNSNKNVIKKSTGYSNIVESQKNIGNTSNKLLLMRV